MTNNWHRDKFPKRGIAVDVGTRGNPGPIEFRGIDIASGETLFEYGPYPNGTNNIGEFLAIIKALVILWQKGDSETPVYSDSKIAISWVKEQTHRSAYLNRNPELKRMVLRGIAWLKLHNPQNPIIFWKTYRWGENIADYGRKR